MKTKIILSLAITLTTLTTFSLTAVAATYQYVNTAGNIQSVEADSTSQALAEATNIAPNSGVMLYVGLTTVVVNNPDNTVSTVPYMTYQYINTVGQVQTITASTADQAFAIAINIALHSGVIQVVANQAGVGV